MRKDQARALRAFEQHCQRRNLSPATIETYRWLLGKFFEAVAKSPQRVTRHDVRRFLAARSPRRHVHELSTLRSFFRVVHEDDPDAVLPTDGMRAGRPQYTPPLLLSEATVQALLRAALSLGRRGRSLPMALRDRACLELLYGTAIRASELRAIRLADLDLHTGRLQVRPAKRGRPRLVFLPQAAMSHVQRYLLEGRPSFVRPEVNDRGRLLLARTGRPWGKNEPYLTIRRVASMAGVRAHPHALRRALSTHLVREGVSVPAVRELLGHASLATTAHYVEVDRAGLHRAVACLDLDDPDLGDPVDAAPPGSSSRVVRKPKGTPRPPRRHRRKP